VIRIVSLDCKLSKTVGLFVVGLDLTKLRLKNRFKKRIFCQKKLLFRRATPSFRHFRLKIKGVRWQWSSTPALLFSRLQFSVSSSGRCGCGSSIDFRFVVVIFLEGKLFYRSIDFAIYLRALCEGGGGGVGLYSRQDRC